MCQAGNRFCDLSILACFTVWSSIFVGPTGIFSSSMPVGFFMHDVDTVYVSSKTGMSKACLYKYDV